MRPEQRRYAALHQADPPKWIQIVSLSSLRLAIFAEKYWFNAVLKDTGILKVSKSCTRRASGWLGTFTGPRHESGLLPRRRGRSPGVGEGSDSKLLSSDYQMAIF